MVTCQIYECDHFGGTLADLLCCPRLAVIDDLREGVIITQGCYCSRPCVNSALFLLQFLTSPLLLKPRISKLMLDVRPVWISCKCLKRLSLALPRPLSSSPWVKTPNRVDLPESTLPRTATRRSRNWRGGINTDETQRTCLEGEHINNTLTNLLVIWHFPDEDLGDLTRHIKIIIHLLLSENSDVGPNSVCNGRKTVQPT